MQYMPLFVDLSKRHILIIGGGSVALRKARQFSEAGAQLQIVAPEIKEGFALLPRTTIEQRKAVPQDISEKYFAVIFATNDKETNENLSKICKKKGIILDRCDDRNRSDFVTGSITAKGSIVNSTISGGIPALSRLINQKVEKLFTPELEKLSQLLEELRPAILASKKLGSVYMKDLVSDKTLDRIKKEGVDLLRQEILACL